MFELTSLILAASGVVLGIFAVVFGGTMFFTIPLMQALFPEATFGTIIGNAKVGSFFRSIGSTISTHKQIAYKDCIKLSAVAFIGTVIGASLIADLGQAWLFPAICIAILFALYAPKLAALVSPKSFHVVSFATGVYAGIFGAGIGILLVALLRLKYPEDSQIAFVKIQARFVEFLLVITAVVTHFLHGNLVAAIWIPWSAGALLGGYLGGIILNKVGAMTPKVQKALLYASFALAFLFAGLKFVESL